MTWLDRQREAALTTPDGTRFVFLYEDLDRNRTENASIFKFAEKSGAFIQRLSSGQDIYPLTIIFSGAEYDIIGADFWEKTKNAGVFLLEHPRFTGFKRVQLLSIKQRVAAKSADNQTTFDVVLHETLEVVQPSTAKDTTTEILNTAISLSSEAAAAFTDNTVLDNSLIIGNLQANSQSLIDSANQYFADIASKESSTNTAFESQFLSAQAAIGNIVDDPLTLANNIAILIATPSRVVTSVDDKINAYINLYNDTLERIRFAGDDIISASKNNASLLTLASLGVLSGMSQASVSGSDYATRADVISIANKVTDVYDSTIQALDEYSDEFNKEVDPLNRRFEITEAMNILNDLMAITIGNLFEIAFSLKQERFITLDRERMTVELTHELYGFSDDNLKTLITTNQLKGDEIYIVPQGKEIVYYI